MEHWAQIEEAERGNRITMAQALASELGISVEDAELLSDAEITTNDSDEGVVYNYWMNLEPVGELHSTCPPVYIAIDHPFAFDLTSRLHWI